MTRKMAFLLQGTVEEVPHALRRLRCKSWQLDYYEREYKANEEITAALIDKHLIPAAIKIQRQFRLWKWRFQVVFNPHTEIGKLNLLIKSNCAAREVEQYLTLHS